MLADGTYGIFILFGSCCCLMMVYAVVCIPETKNVPLKSIYLLFEGYIIRGATRDTFPSRARSKTLQAHSYVKAHNEDGRRDVKAGDVDTPHVEEKRVWGHCDLFVGA